MELLRRIPNKDIEICFVVHEKMSKQVVANGFSVVILNSNSQLENRNCFRKALKEFMPDLFICADVFTMDFSSTWSGVDLAELKATGIPVGTLDDYEWESTHFLQDFSGIPMKMKSELITQSDFLIRPCPVNRPNQETSSKIINCSLFDIEALLEKYRKDIKMKSNWRESMGIKKDAKVVMIVNSPWEYVEVGRRLETVRLIEWLPRVIQNYLLALEVPLTVLHVGGKKWKIIDDRLIDYRYYIRVNPTDYNCMINCVDLFCGTNLISVTLSRAALCGVPVVLFQNEKYIDFRKLNAVLGRMPDWYREMAGEVKKIMPFKVFPWGWFKFLEPVMADNPYGAIFNKAPLFEPKKCLDVIRKSIFDEEHKVIIEKKREEYIKMLDLLAPPSKILEVT
ncbi:DUF6365 family protein [Clostridiaceae bacterium M8S5]|nr:DUF6365 family protein [Clostridiaceae bacterium M8S5]